MLLAVLPAVLRLRAAAALAVLLALSAPPRGAAKECTNIPTQSRSLRERERELAMLQILKHEGASSNAGDEDSTFWRRKQQPHQRPRNNGHGGERRTSQAAGRTGWEGRSLLARGAGRLLSPWHRGLNPEEKARLKTLIWKEYAGRTLRKDPQSKFLHDVPLHHVRLRPGSAQYDAQDTNLRYLLMLDPERLIWSFRTTAGLPAPGKPYLGWESPGSELRGHFVGHYLSATAMAWASTDNSTLKGVMDYVVAELDACQKALGSGYLSAFPSEFFDRFEAIQPVWAPYYTIHKIMAGLVDQFELAGNERALAMVTRMAAYFKARVDNVIAEYTIERHWRSLNEEFGGMNDVLYRLYTITGDQDHLELAHLFDKPCFLGPLALHTDDLSGFHSNTHIPIVIGGQTRYEVTGDPVYREISLYFMHLINSSHSFSSGGTSSFEFWADPHRLGDQLAQEDQESCTTYNMLKVARNLFRWTQAASYLDYFEKAFVNGVLGVQRGTEPGVMIYMLPHGPGNSKARGYHGWGTPFDSFWCCYGTGIESFSKLGDSIYFQRPSSTLTPAPALYIAQYVPSTLDWYEGGIQVTQEVEGPTSADPVLRVSISIDELRPDGGGSGVGEEEGEAEGGMQTQVASEFWLRIPGWAAPPLPYRREDLSHGEECSPMGGDKASGDRGAARDCWLTRTGAVVNVNGVQRTFPRPGQLHRIKRAWLSSDSVKLAIALGLRAERIQDDRPAFASLHSILLGPYLLVGLTDKDNALAPSFDPANPAASITPMDPAQNANLVTLAAVVSETMWAGRHEWVRNKWGSEWAIAAGAGAKGVHLREMPRVGTDAAAACTFRVVPINGQGGLQNGLLSSAADRAGQFSGLDGQNPVRSGDVVRRRLQKASVGAGASQAAVPLGHLLNRRIYLEPYHLPGHILTYDASLDQLQVSRREGLAEESTAVQQFVLQEDRLGSGIVSLMPAILSGALGPISLSYSLSGISTFTPLNWEVRPGLAQYADITFSVAGASRNFLLQPIAHMRDESYTSYFNVTG